MDKDNLKQIRNTRGILQRDITDKYGISQSYYSLIENGYRNPSLDFAKKIALALNISLEEVYYVLFRGRKNSTKKTNELEVRNGKI